MKEQMVTLLKEMVDIESISGNEGPFARFLRRRLEASGYAVREQEVSKGRHNLLAVRGAPRILFCTHMDTVAPFIPFSLDGDILRGRGACDAKGSMASMLLAADRLVAEGRDDCGFLFVVGEETTSDGAKKACEMGLRAEYVILGEPTGNLIASAQKGTLVFRVITRGVSGHSAEPSSGRSALHRMVSVAQGWLDSDWGSDPVRGETTLNIGTIRGGVAANVIAAECEAEGIFRLSGPASETESKLKSDYADDPDISIEILSSSEPLDLMEVPGFEHTVVAFGSDAPFLAGMGKVVMSGPGSISHAHSSEEQVELRELLEGVEVYHRLATLL